MGINEQFGTFKLNFLLLLLLLLLCKMKDNFILSNIKNKIKIKSILNRLKCHQKLKSKLVLKGIFIFSQKLFFNINMLDHEQYGI